MGTFYKTLLENSKFYNNLKSSLQELDAKIKAITKLRDAYNDSEGDQIELIKADVNVALNRLKSLQSNIQSLCKNLEDKATDYDNKYDIIRKKCQEKVEFRETSPTSGYKYDENKKLIKSNDQEYSFTSIDTPHFIFDKVRYDYKTGYLIVSIHAYVQIQYIHIECMNKANQNAGSEIGADHYEDYYFKFGNPNNINDYQLIGAKSTAQG